MVLTVCVVYESQLLPQQMYHQIRVAAMFVACLLKSLKAVVAILIWVDPIGNSTVESEYHFLHVSQKSIQWFKSHVAHRNTQKQNVVSFHHLLRGIKKIVAWVTGRSG